MTDNKPVTRNDVEEIVEDVVGRVVGEIVGDALTMISGRFDTVEADISGLKTDVTSLKEDVSDLRATTNRIENKLDATIDKVDDHEVQITALKTSANL